MRKLPALLLPLLLALPAIGAVSPIRIVVDQLSETQRPKTSTVIKGPVSNDTTQVRSLTIKLENNSQETFDNLVVKYWFFGHDARGRDAKPIASGERKSFLNPNSRETVDSETVSFKYTPEYTQVLKDRAGRAYSAKRIPASGTKITGYAVQVFNGTTKVAEYYSDNGYKDQVAPPAPPKPALKPAWKSQLSKPK